MNILVLDCAFKPIVSVIRENKQVVFNETQNENHSDNFMLLLDKSLKEADLTINDVDQIMLNLGPGSFTGLRVAVSIAKGLGFGDDKKFLPFTSFDYLDNNISVLVNGFSNFVYKRDKNGEMSCESVSSLGSTNYETVNFDLYEKLRAMGYNVAYKEKRSYLDIYNRLEKKYLKINELEPLYLKKSQAEEEREKKSKKVN